MAEYHGELETCHSCNSTHQRVDYSVDVCTVTDMMSVGCAAGIHRSRGGEPIHRVNMCVGPGIVRTYYSITADLLWPRR